METLEKLTTVPGSPLPLGATPDSDGTQFSLFSRNATSITLVLFTGENPVEITLDPKRHKTGDIWHIWVKGIGGGQHYGYRADGPYFPEAGHRFNKHKLLLDPYGRALCRNIGWDLAETAEFDHTTNEERFSTRDTSPFVPRSIVVDVQPNEEKRSLNLPYEDLIIYETHVRGYTKDGSSKVASPGTYKGLTEKIPYLKELGITAIELLPVHDFDENENPRMNPQTGEKLKNFWGYSSLSFFSPCGRYAEESTYGDQAHEFKDMVNKFHEAGIEVILDVVYNHTAEGDHRGPCVAFRGLENSIYYILEQHGSDRYTNYSGCGNTFNCNHPAVQDLIIDSLRYWVTTYHIDGFRFDLASILARSQDGTLLPKAPLVERIEQDPVLTDTKIIAEPWDAAGAYQVGAFPGRWAEWNGTFRDDVRRFWRGDDGFTGGFATRIAGSSDLYEHNGRKPLNSINFITSHDGFTLNDLVSYTMKHNEANGENNIDGDNNNFSFNYGTEGLALTPFIERVRIKQIKNLIATLFLAQGVPMLLAGDEFRRTQGGNNNAYCQDNSISWVDWSCLEDNSEIFNFTRNMIQFRKGHPVLRKENFIHSDKEQKGQAALSWHGVHPYKPDWGVTSKLVACMLNGSYGINDEDKCDKDIYIAFNASLYNMWITLPESPSGLPWKKVIDTSCQGDDSFIMESKRQVLQSHEFRSTKQSTTLFMT